MKGLTLIEMMIVTSIIALLAAFSLANYRAGGKNLDQARTLQTIAQAIRTAQQRSLTSDCPTAPCRFGAHFDTANNFIYIFDDDIADTGFNGQYGAGEEVETITLEKDIVITSITHSPLNTAINSVDVLFVPPDPIAVTNTGISFPITITITGGRLVTVNERGSIDIQ